MASLLARIAVVLVSALLVAALAWIGKLWYDSRLPETYNVMDFGTIDDGRSDDEPESDGGTGHGSHGVGRMSVADLHGPTSGTPDAVYTLTASEETVRLASGRELQGLTFNGISPGPELRVRRGDLVQVTLRNDDIERGVTIHWHGVDVPNAEDGVAGVTQDAVLPGERHVYRFRADQEGTFWYHAHQAASRAVRLGLFGALVIEPRVQPKDEVDLVVAAHTFAGVPTLNGSDVVERRRVAPGTLVRLRLVNSDSTSQRFTLAGTAFRVAAIDGTELNAPTPIRNTAIPLGGGARADLEFRMPRVPVRLSLVGSEAGLALSRDGRQTRPAPLATEDFDPTSYGRPAPTPFDASSPFDRRFELTIDKKPGFFDGRPGLQWSLNGEIYPDVPAFVVEDGDLVAMTVRNKTDGVHPMHLHGHHVLVLSRNGRPSTGSPWWVDTLSLEDGETYEVAFRADNPGLWMDHCHNLRHAADGLTMHVVYAGVTTPFNVGDDHHNLPE